MTRAGLGKLRVVLVGPPVRELIRLDSSSNLSGVTLSDAEKICSAVFGS